MIARLTVASALFAAAQAADLTVTCADDHGGLIRIGSTTPFRDIYYECDGTTPSSSDETATVNEPDITFGNIAVNSMVTFITRYGSGAFAGMGGASGCDTSNSCQFMLTADGTVEAPTDGNTDQFVLFDCATANADVMGRFGGSNIDGAEEALDMEDEFTCGQTIDAPDSAPSTIVPSTNVRAFAVEVSGATPDEPLLSVATTNMVLTDPLAFPSSASTSMVEGCSANAVGESTCEYTIGLGSFTVLFTGGMVPPVETPGCTFACTSVGGTGCAASTTTNIGAACVAGAVAVNVQGCIGGNQGSVVCVPAGSSVNGITAANANALVALFGDLPNGQAAIYSFYGVLISQGYTFSFGTTCTACVAASIGSSGFLSCASCSVLAQQNDTTIARQGNGVRVLICGNTAATAQDDCLEAAACQNFLEGAACFRAGVAVACPPCPVEVESSSSSKKGLLGLLGLLAIIPAILLLCSLILCCCMLLKRRKRPVPVPVVPTVAPMTSVVEPVVCGGTIGAAPMACSPYGSAYPCM